MAKSSSGQLFVKLPQFVVETTEGTIPTSSPTLTSCGNVTSLSVKKDSGFVEVGQVGQEDLLGLIEGLNSFELQVKFTLPDSTFLKKCLNAANYATPSGTISETISILWSQYLNGTENYIIAKGCRAKDVTLVMDIGKPIECTASFECMAITVPSSSHGLTTPTFASAPSSTIWSWTTGGATPISWNGSAIDAKKFSITVNRNTKPDYILGAADPHSTQPHGRRIAGDMTVLWDATTLETDYAAGTARTIAAVLKTATSTITVTSAVLTTYSKDDSESDTEGTIEVCGFKALSVSVT